MTIEPVFVKVVGHVATLGFSHAVSIHTITRDSPRTQCIGFTFHVTTEALHTYYIPR